MTSRSSWCPVHTNSGSKKVHIPILVLFVSVAFLLHITNSISYFTKQDNTYKYQAQLEVFAALMLLLPLVRALLRLDFFVRRFSFALWHYPSYMNPASGVQTMNTQILLRLSLLLRRPVLAKKLMRRNLRCGWLAIMAVVLTALVLRMALYAKYGDWSIFAAQDWLYGVSYALLCALVLDVPDLLLLLAARLHLTECLLQLQALIGELRAMSLDEVVECHGDARRDAARAPGPFPRVRPYHGVGGAVGRVVRLAVAAVGQDLEQHAH